jgi:1-acyl-sn-glycerol-3-phosphate acyltransferase
MTPALRLFYRRIYTTGLEMIPAKGPAIILANHPSAVMDAAVMGVLLDRPVYFFTRGDVFIDKRVNWLLERLRMLPVHNHEKGRNTLHNNDESFIKAEKILADGGILLFFPEGNSRIKRNLSPLRKGVFRLAFQAAMKNNFSYDIPFIPAGLTYDHPTAGYRDVMVHFGKPFFLSKYREAYEANPNNTLLQMTKDGFAAMEKNLLHINEERNYSLVEKLLTVHQNNYRFFTDGWLQGNRRRFEEEKHICNSVNKLKEEERAALEKQADDYFRELQRYGLADDALSPSFSFSPVKRALLLITLPLFVLSYFLNALPLLISKRIADDKAQRIDYYSWVLVCCSVFLYIAWLMVLFFGFLIVGWAFAISIDVIALLTISFFFYYKRSWRACKQYMRLQELKEVNPEIIKQLVAKRQKLS